MNNSLLSSGERYFDYNILKRLTLNQKKEVVKRLKSSPTLEGLNKTHKSLLYPWYNLHLLHNHEHASLRINDPDYRSKILEVISQQEIGSSFLWLDDYYKTVDMTKEPILRQPLIPISEQVGNAWRIFNRIKEFKQDKDESPFIMDLFESAPNVDHSHIRIEHLLGLSELKMYNLQQYFNNMETAKPIRLLDDNRFQQFQEMLVKVNSQLNTLVSIDVEAYEKKQNTITEIGICIYDPLKNGLSHSGNFHKIHILIKESLRLRNGLFVPDNKDNFLGGSSLILDHKTAAKFINAILHHYFITRKYIGMQGILVGHSVQGDIKWLAKSLGVKFPQDLQIVDSQRLFQLVNGDANSSLGALLRRLDIPHSYLHNGGNDAYYTLVLLMKLCDPQVRLDYNLDSDDENEKYNNLVKLNKQFQATKRRSGNNSKLDRKKHKVTEFLPHKKFENENSALYSIFGKRNSKI